ncbi:MAG TPA: RNA polymerase sigma factor [Gaiellaceae bacterium]|nr:RNA polymerase sigma factor [Gaiellaceae bacterium]
MIYRAELGRLRRVARAIVGDADAARDVVQEAFASAVRDRARFRGDGSPLGWIWQMVVNGAISEQRRCRRQAVGRLPVEDEVPSPNGDFGEQVERVAAALALLPERQRLTVFLHYYADLDYRAIAEVLQVAPGTVGASLHAARQTLLRILAEEDAQL